MAQDYVHNGVKFFVEVTEAKRNEWTWWYRIEDGRNGKMSDRSLPTEELALDEGKRAAEFRIDGR